MTHIGRRERQRPGLLDRRQRRLPAGHLGEHDGSTSGAAAIKSPPPFFTVDISCSRAGALEAAGRERSHAVVAGQLLAGSWSPMRAGGHDLYISLAARRSSKCPREVERAPHPR